MFIIIFGDDKFPFLLASINITKVTYNYFFSSARIQFIKNMKYPQLFQFFHTPLDLIK